MRPTVAVHGGAGLWNIGEEERERVKRALRDAVEEGLTAVQRGSALDAVVASVEYMEKSGVFNAGYGAAYAADGAVYLDAGVMDGRTKKAGAVAAVGAVKSAVRLARLVMEQTDHVILAGEGAMLLAARAGLLEARHRFYSEGKNRRFGEVLEEARRGRWPYRRSAGLIGDTVGAVALDREGNVAAATSTGGVWLKWPGRVGDSPIPGAGYWAENGVGAFSATGLGEAILMSHLCLRARDALVEMGDVAKAVERAVGQITEAYGSDTAGIIAVDARGNTAYAFNTKAMARGWGRPGEPIYAEL
ncbi:isoaspartyl peptidase/L-asparaginase [Pyrobaculum neutrophilum]|uniref:Plant-type L-asparaginase n=1 Tax=Pyrobaculum neutrophilum (strain DSM 2338 / JCM 9278 / NBRC 100436 / V24Sta) TaxID=444157 RepID=B1Y9B9_PYRNV|nr:isoaspartyl peptidase/L-asparaginase [Pyrobaculum neutrophilum]ACB40348.1 peptidase T2 asparaginase 2 [Pyrobaculum neutrophilum V24Sta]